MPRASRRYGRQYGSPTDEAWEDFYQRFKNVAVPLFRRGYGLAFHPKDSGLFKDMGDRLANDPEWVVKFGDNSPVLIENKRVKEGTFQPVSMEDPALPVSMRKALRSNIGFGRWKGVQLPTGGEISDPFGERDKRKADPQ